MLKIKKEIFDEIIQHCRSCLPYEACGILAGKNSFVRKLYKIKNIESSSVSYFMKPEEQLKAMKDIREKELEILAIFHSHTFGSAYPSQKDIELALYDVYYLIVALEPELEIRCFKIKEREIKEEKLIIERNF